MIYAAASIWLMLAVLLAWGVDRLWADLAKPKTLRIILFPGTAIAQLGRIIGLLITGAKVVQVAAPDGEGGGKTKGADWEPKLPIIGPLIVALLPMAFLAIVIYIVGVKLGYPVLVNLPADEVSTAVPMTLSAFWDQVRALVTLCQGTLDAVRAADTEAWKISLFIYLMACLTIRLAPLPGNIRGHLGAIIAFGITTALIGTVLDGLPNLIQRAWPLLALAVGWLLLMLLLSLLVRAAVVSAKMFLQAE